MLGVIEEGASTVNQVVARRRALGSRRALWFYLAAVTAIIAGLLAMHSLSLEEDQAGTVGCVKLRRRSLCGFQAAVAVWA